MESHASRTPVEDVTPEALISVEAKEENQDSPGDLNVPPNLDQHPPSTYEYFADVPPDSIQRISPIPDYTENTVSPHPILVKTPGGLFCLDGQGLIASARESGRDSIKCYVSELPDHSEEELALRKAAVRENAPGGKPLYAERVRNVCRLFDLLSQSGDVRRYAHGGDRKGLSFQEHNHFENVVTVIAQRLGKSPTTINMLRNYGEHLNQAILERLVQEKVTKNFFEEVQPNKRDLLKCLQSDQKSTEEITSTISSKMLEWIEEFKRTNKIERVFPQRQTEEVSTQQNAVQAPTPTVFEHWAGAEIQDEQSISLDALKEEASAACDAFKTRLADPGLELEQFRQMAMDLARKLTECALKTRALGESSSSEGDDS